MSFMTSVKVIRAAIRGAEVDGELEESAAFVAIIFSLGFVCGVVTWAGSGLHRYLGIMGDAIVGMVVMVTFFVGCALVFSPEILGNKFANSGVLMLGMAAVLGVIGGIKFGRDWRKTASGE